MKFLTKIGQIFLKATEVVMGFAPIIQQAYPGTTAIVNTVSKDLAEIADVIVQIEVVGQALSLAGPQKLQAAVGPVTQVILQSSLLANHKIADSLLFRAGCQKVADGMADILNSLHSDIDTASKV